MPINKLPLNLPPEIAVHDHNIRGDRCKQCGHDHSNPKKNAAGEIVCYCCKSYTTFEAQHGKIAPLDLTRK